MRNVTITYKVNGENVTVEGLTVARQEKQDRTAVLFTYGDTSFVQWYDGNFKNSK